MDSKNITVTVEVIVKAPVEKVWECWTAPDHITNWNFATKEWCCPSAKNDLQPGGEFTWRMEAKDGSMGFDFGWRTMNDIDSTSISQPSRDTGSEMLIGISYTAVMFFFVLIKRRKRFRIAAEPKLFDKLLPLFVII